MNREEVITTIKIVGNRFSQVMAALCGAEFGAGYNRAIADMINLFRRAPLDEDFEAERNTLLTRIKELEIKNEELDREACEQYATVEELLKHVNLPEVLGVGVKRPVGSVPRRRVTIKFK